MACVQRQCWRTTQAYSLFKTFAIKNKKKRQKAIQLAIKFGHNIVKVYFNQTTIQTLSSRICTLHRVIISCIKLKTSGPIAKYNLPPASRHKSIKNHYMILALSSTKSKVPANRHKSCICNNHNATPQSLINGSDHSKKYTNKINGKWRDFFITSSINNVIGLFCISPYKGRRESHRA